MCIRRQYNNLTTIAQQNAAGSVKKKKKRTPVAPNVGYQVALSLSLPPLAHTRAGTNTHTQSNVFRLYPGQNRPTQIQHRLSAHNLSTSLRFCPPPSPLFLFLIPLRFVTFSFLVLSLFKCQLHSTFIQICVARICLDIARQYINIYNLIYNIHTQFYILIKLNMCVISFAGCASPLRVKVSSSCDFQWIYRVLLCVSEGLGILPQIC